MTALPRHDSDLDGRLTRDKLHVVLAAICAQVGIEPNDAELIKFTNNAVFRLPRASVVVRIAGSATAGSRAHKVVQVARWLAAHNVPTVRLLPGIGQPIEVGGQLATLWHAVPAVGAPPTGTDLANILRAFHAIPAPPDLPPWRPLDEIRQRLTEPEGLADAELAFREIEEELTAVKYVLPPGLIHGDAFLGNLIPGPGGAVICDFDSTSVGPREWDLTPVAVGKLRFDYAADTQRELSEGYGFDVTRWNGLGVLRQVRELKLVTSVVPILRSNPTIRDQWRYRFEAFRRGDTAAKWTTYR